MSGPVLLTLLVAAFAADPLPVPAVEPHATAEPPAAAPSPDPHPTYPLGPGRTPHFRQPGDPLRLTDLHFGLADDGGTTQSFGARVQIGRLGLIGVEFEGERRTFSLLARRTQVRLTAIDGRIAAAASVRLRRVIVSADFAEPEAGEPKGSVFRPTLALRVTNGLELLGGLETDSRRVDGAALRATSGGVLWQRGASFEATGLFVHEKVRTEAPVAGGAHAVNTVDSIRLAVIGQLGRHTELSAKGTLADTDGRFPRTELDGEMGARLALAPRLRVEGRAWARYQDGAGTLGHDVRGGVTWFARRQTLPRAGEAARRSAALARRATRLGLNERRSDAEGDRREQRLRLALDGRAEDLLVSMQAAYEAQVLERDVPLLGVEYTDMADSVVGGERSVWRGFVGVPWPPSLPWQENPAAVPFLSLDLARERSTTSISDSATTWRFGLTLSLSRELDGVVRWSRVHPTSYQLVRGVGRHDVLDVSAHYAFGR